MTFLAPLFLLGGLAVIVPIVLHLYARDAAEPVPFSLVRFVRATPVEQRRRRRLSDLLLLLLRVAALALLALSFARPFLASGTSGASPRATVLLVDRSFSLSAPATWPQVVRRALEAIDAQPAGRQIAVVAFDDAAKIVLPPTSDRAAVRRAVDGLRPGWGATRYAVALAAARETLARRPGDVVLVTDAQRPTDDEATLRLPSDVKLQVVEIPPPPGNLAAVALHRGGRETIGVVTNYGPVDRATRAHLVIDGVGVASVEARIPASGSVDLRFPVPLPAKGSAALAIEDAEGPAADNERFVALDPPASVRVLIIADVGNARHSGFYVDRALAATEEDGPFDAGVRRADDPALDHPGTLDGVQVVALTATRGLSRRGRELLATWLEAGGGLLLAAGPATEPGHVRDVLRSVPVLALSAPDPDRLPAALAPVEVRHPVVSALGPYAGNLAQVRFDNAVDVAEGAGLRVIARLTTGRPALVEVAAGRGRALVVASDLGRAWNQFPLQPTFLPFVQESIRYLAGLRSSTRDLLVADVGGGTPPQPGVIVTGKPPRQVAVNVDLSESAPDRLGARRLAASISTTDPPLYRPGREREERESEQSLWRYGLMLLLAVLAAEGMIGSRWGRSAS